MKIIQVSNLFDRQTLDRKSDSNKGYAYHVKYEHNLWHYLFFVAYVRDKEETELTGMESYVADQIEKEEVDWFPIERFVFCSFFYEPNI